jgi:hypothetical protein
MIRFRGNDVYRDIFARTLPELKRARMGSYSWGLVNGRSQAQYEWESKAGSPEPKVWFTDLFRDAQGTPFDAQEIEAIKAVSRGKDRPGR